MAASLTPPPLQGPSSKEKKYDRQLRLWAASGQQALEEAHVLLVNSGSGVAGIEALKNLILPGIGNFTIVDDAIVAEADLGVNFFLEQNSLGLSRAEECCRLLLELNPDVTGTHISQASQYPFLGRAEIANCIAAYRILGQATRLPPKLLPHPHRCANPEPHTVKRFPICVGALHTPVLYPLRRLLLSVLRATTTAVPNRRHSPRSYLHTRPALA